MTLRSELETILTYLRDGLVYDEDKFSLKSRLLSSFMRISDALRALDGQEKVELIPSGRFCLVLPSMQVWIGGDKLSGNSDGAYGMTPERHVYFIDGYITESKILAIKQVRTLDGTGLKDAKDFVDGLLDKAVRSSRI